MLGCLFSAASAVAHGEAVLVAWSVSALLSSALALYLLHHQRELYMSTSLRDWLYAGMRIHRACAIVGVRRWVPDGLLSGGVVSQMHGGLCHQITGQNLPDTT